MQKEHAADPLALIQPMKPGKDGGQLQVMRGVNFELAMFLAQLTGAVLYTDQRARLLVPPNGYGLTAVRRFLVTFGRRRHLAAVPFAILFGRAASGGTGTAPTS